VVDIATVTTAIGAATSAVTLIDKLADGIERVLTGKKDGATAAAEHREKIERDGDSIVSKRDGKVCQRVTAQELKDKLQESELQLIQTREQSMQNHFKVWSDVYPQLALMSNPIAKAQTKERLKQIIDDMKGDLEGILGFLQCAGLHLDDHYMHIRSIVKQT
jgi:hypothetical protein